MMLKRLSAALARGERAATQARGKRDAALKKSTTLSSTAAAADAGLKKLIGKRGGVEHVLEALAKPREEGGFSITEKTLIAAGASTCAIPASPLATSTPGCSSYSRP